MWKIETLGICAIFGPDCNTRMNVHLFKMLLEEFEISVKFNVTDS